MKANEITKLVTDQCNAILSAYPIEMFDAEELAFLKGKDRSIDASSQLNYMGYLIERNYIVLPRQFTSYVDQDMSELTISHVASLANNGLYLKQRIASMAKYARRQAKEEVTPQVIEPITVWEHPTFGTVQLTYKELFMDHMFKYNLTPNKVRKAIEAGKGTVGGWALLSC